jgi:excisionase family DNA binding protein
VLFHEVQIVSTPELVSPAPGEGQDHSTPRLGRSVSLMHAAQLLNVSRRTIYYRIRAGRLRTIRTLGGSQRVLLDSLFACGVRPPAERDGDGRSAAFTLEH